MTKEQVHALVLKHIRGVLADLDRADVPAEASLRDLGANSMDRADIVALCLEDLQLEIPLVETRGAATIGELVNVLYEQHQRRASRSSPPAGN